MPDRKKAYIEKNKFDPDAARDAYQYSFHKVNAMEHGQDITSAAMEQLGFSSEKKETILDKRINAYLAAQLSITNIIIMRLRRRLYQENPLQFIITKIRV